LVASSGDGKVRVYHGASFDLVKTLDFGKNSDDVRYDPVAERIYVGYDEDGTGAIGIIVASLTICSPKLQ
jgi:hypothetical protein